MRVVASNSGCCAIKIIRDFYGKPESRQFVNKLQGHEEDCISTEPAPYANWADTRGFPESMPNSELFLAYVKQIKERRPAGRIEVNLAADWCEGDDYDDYEPYWDEGIIPEWREIFEKAGFKEEIFYNSNSGARIHQFSLTYDERDS